MTANLLVRLSPNGGRFECAPGQTVLDAALAKEFPGGMLRRNWAGETLELSGPGAKGTITFEDGKLVGRASLGPPASMMRGMIEQKIGTAMRTAAA